MENEKFWLKRHTVRRFSDEDVPESLLIRLLEDASHAPTLGNMQLYSVIISRDKENLRKLAEAHFNQPAATGAPVILTFCADFNRMVKWCKASDATPGYDNFHGFISALIDVTIFTQQFVTAAEMAGLGCCYLGTTTYNAPRIAEILGTPQLVVPVNSISVGFPSGDEPTTDRLPIEAIVNLERYNNHSEHQIKEYYAAKEALDEMKNFVRENGVKNLAQVFTDVRYTKADYELYSRIYKDFINNTGYHF